MGTVYTVEDKIEAGESVVNSAIFKLDLSSPESIERCANEIIATGEKIDILINNAGALLDEDGTGVVIEKLRKTPDVDLVGPIDFTERLIS